MAKSFLNIAGYPLGLRNNNPGNLRATGDQWQGMIGTNQGFVVFQDIAYGIRALAIDLGGDIRQGLNTIEKLISEFAPPSENDTRAYIVAVSAAAGIAYNQILQPDGSTLLKIIRGIIRMENGSQYAALINDDDIKEGIEMTGTMVPVGKIGFGISAALLGLTVYLVATMPKKSKARA
jgi:hypothetical protein